MATRDQADGSVDTEIRGQILLIGINRPKKLNGFTPQMLTDLHDAYAMLEDNDELRVGVLHAYGDHTTAGLDLPKIAPLMESGESLFPEGSPIDPFELTSERRKPVVAAVKGICFTIGIELMLACDIVVAADNCRFSQLEVKRNLMPTGGATIRITERAGYGNAMYLMLTAGEVDAQTALRWGLVQEVVPAGEELDRAIDLANQIAEQAPEAVIATRHNALLSMNAGKAAAVAEFVPVQQRLRAMKDGQEAIASFVEKRKPVFTGT